MNIHGQNCAFPAVVSNVFPALASQDIFRNGVFWVRCDHMVLLGVIGNGELYLQKQPPPKLFCKLVVPKVITFLFNKSNLYNNFSEFSLLFSEHTFFSTNLGDCFWCLLVHKKMIKIHFAFSMFVSISRSRSI